MHEDEKEKNNTYESIMYLIKKISKNDFMISFHIGQTSLDVCKVILAHHPLICAVTLVSHAVEINWREHYKTTEKKMAHLSAGFTHSPPIKEKKYLREEFFLLTLEDLSCDKENQVWSIISKVHCSDGKTRHIPLMNFHFENGSQEDIKKILEHFICKGKGGVLVESGRFHHYYGDFLLEEQEWIQYMAQFLMPIFLVSPRYIGHRLHEGYCTLRLTSEKHYKPKIPQVVAVF